MTVRIGEHYADAERQRVTPVEYNNTKYEVFENLWTNDDAVDEWQVTLHIGDEDIGIVNDASDIHEWLREQLDKVEVLTGLDYDVYDCDDGVAFWSKSSESSTNDNNTH